MVTSILAGIVDRQGGIRVVVTSSANIHCHVNEGEKLFIVPEEDIDLFVKRGDYVYLIERAFEYVQSHGD